MNDNALRDKSSILPLFVLTVLLAICISRPAPPAFADESRSKLRPHIDYAAAPYERSEYSVDAAGIARVSVLIDGERARVYSHRGQYYVEGRQGRNYTLLITNLTGRRIKVSAAVDGLDVIDGRRASYDKPGYIINPYSNANIKGWRISDYEVASFRFGPISESYAMKMDSPSEIGVMSFGFFKERRPEVYIDDYDYDYPLYKKSDMGGRPERAATASEWKKKAPSGEAGAPAQSIGTEFGARRDSRVSHTSFDPETSYPQAVVKINYASYEDLVRRGVIGGDIIITDDSKPPVRKTDDESVYARPPEDWRR